MESIRGLLVSAGFREDSITVLADPMHLIPRVAGPPTRANILRAMQWLVAGAQPGDVLFFQYSGHGAQVADNSGMESDGYNETICPCDYRDAGQIVDDEIWLHLVAPLPSGVRLTAIMDCCHSGTGMDLPFTWNPNHGQWREDENPSHSCGDVILFSGCQDDQTSSDGDIQRFKIGGAMTNAFIRALQEDPYNPFPTYPEFLSRLQRQLRARGFTQRPQLSSSQAFNVAGRVFSITDGIEPNRNMQIGRIQRRKFRPRWDGPQAEGAALAALVLAGLFL